MSSCPCNVKKQPCCGTLPSGVSTSTVTSPCGPTLPGPICKPCVGEFTPYDDPIEPKKPETQLVVVKTCEKKSKPCQLPLQGCQRLRCIPPTCRTVCFECPPKREDCYPAVPRCYELAYADAFENFDIKKCKKGKQSGTPRWFYFSNNTDYTADDGKFGFTPSAGLSILAQPYTKSYPQEGDSPIPQGWLDGFKTFILLNSQFELRECGELRAETCVAAKIETGSWRDKYTDGVYNATTDPRIAYASAVNIYAPSQGLLLEVGLTNVSIVAGYHRLPELSEFGGSEGTYASFFSFALIGYRSGVNSKTDFMKVAVGLDAFLKKATYYLEGSPVHTFNNIGVKPNPELVVQDFGGFNEYVVPSWAYVGFGVSNMLNATIPSFTSAIKDSDYLLRKLCKLSTEETFDPWAAPHGGLIKDQNIKPIPAIIEQPAKDDRLFGQGAILNLKSLTVTYAC